MARITYCKRAMVLMSVLVSLSCAPEVPSKEPRGMATPKPAIASNPLNNPSPRIIIDSPDVASIGLVVTFQWHIQDSKAGEVYRYKVRLDKGENACDDHIEEDFDAGTKTCLKVSLPSDIYDNADVNFAIQATDSQSRTFCTQGRRFTVNPQLPASPGCEGEQDEKKKSDSNTNSPRQRK